MTQLQITNQPIALQGKDKMLRHQHDSMNTIEAVFLPNTKPTHEMGATANDNLTTTEQTAAKNTMRARGLSIFKSPNHYPRFCCC